MRRQVIAATLIALTSFILVQPALAAPDQPRPEPDGYSLNEITKHKKLTSKSPTRHGMRKNTAAEEVREFKRSQRQYLSQMRDYDACMNSGDTTTCQPPAAPTPGAAFGKAGDLTADTISDEDAAYIAFARLRLTPPSPVIGPSPDLNRWKMAAVGYPLWLSVAGDPAPPAVADAVADVHVRLQAHATKVVFSMGDHHTVSCTHVTTAWSEAAAGKKSPDCGYTYTKPSLPKRNYTVTATTYWSVAWSTSGGSGVIPFIQSSSTQLPVGELQVLVR